MRYQKRTHSTGLMKMPKILYEVECGALVLGKEEDAERTTVRCYIHNKLESITRVQISEWLVNCQSCAWRRWYGIDKELANDESRRHWLRNPAHKCTVQKRNRRAAQDAELTLKRKIAQMGLLWYNGRVRLPQKEPEVTEDIPPF